VPTPVVALTIAGTDSAGGAGLHADLRTFAAFGVHGASAVAALTAQNTLGIEGLHLVPPGFVSAQIESVLSDLDVQATKTGFLGSAGTVQAVGTLADEGRLPRLVVDPVLATATGERIFDRSVEEAYLDHLLGAAFVTTPNRVEAGILLGRELRTVADMEQAALALASTGPSLVVVKGGDADDEGDDAVDVMAFPDGRIEHLVLPRLDTGNDHGSGCSFAAATTARLALGDEPADAVRAAKRFVHDALAGSAGWRLGAGHGPLDQLGWNRS
jgi:hydroxymethylpyrimidine/phosphomethylpyrimidine kinase